MIALETNDAVDALISSEQPVWIFKHSQACGTSFNAHDEVVTYLEQHADEVLGIVVVQTHRPVSNYIAEKLGVIHKSPQLFLVQGGQVLWSASHYSISQANMAAARAQAAA